LLLIITHTKVDSLLHFVFSYYPGCESNMLVALIEIFNRASYVISMSYQTGFTFCHDTNPILVGQSGQIKEYREETFYSEIGDKHHRHISHLCPLYPGTLINSTTRDWLDAAIITLDLRGNNTTGWAMAHRMNLRARTKEGDKAHEVYAKFIKERTLPNLWTTHPPFQIDGSFGCMASVAEMLLQSHEGFIEPLAALPKAWNNGEYKGLVARGNFEISTVWKNGKATSFEILSKSGGVCTIKYPGIGNARLNDASGNIISFDKEGVDLIGFETKKGGIYFIVL